MNANQQITTAQIEAARQALNTIAPKQPSIADKLVQQALNIIESEQTTIKRTIKSSAADKLTQAKEIWESVQTNGIQDAADRAGKSAHYTKLIALAYDLYRQSKKIRTAYDKGQITWSVLYDLAFRFRKADTIQTAEARLADRLAA